MKWCEVSKTGSDSDRNRWLKKKYDLVTHNEASAEIYKDSVKKSNSIIYVLILMK